MLAIDYPEHIPYTAHVSLAKPRSRRQYAEAAAEYSGIDQESVERLLVDLSSERVAEMEAAAEAGEEDEDTPEPLPEISVEEIDSLIGEPGVLGRFVEDTARCSGVIGERDLLGLQGLAAFSAARSHAQRHPLGVNVMLTGPAGRGKNRICDAVAKLLPETFYYAFESASAKALYYAAEDNPAFLKYHWLYPNETEGVDLLVELWPLLSGGSPPPDGQPRRERPQRVSGIDLEGPMSRPSRPFGTSSTAAPNADAGRRARRLRGPRCRLAGR